MNTNNNAGAAGIDLDKLEALARAATPGPWDTETVRSEGEYGTDEDCGRGFDAYAVVDGEGRPLMDSLNRDQSEIHEEYSDEAHYAWDELAKRDAQFIAAANPATVLKLIALARSAAHAAPAAQAVDQARSPEGDPWREVTAEQYAQAERNGYEVRTLYVANPAPVAAHAEPYAYEQDNGADTELVYAAWFANGLGKMDPDCIYRPLYLTPSAAPGKADAANAGNRVLMDQWNAGAALLLFQEWKGYPLPKLNADGNFDKDWLHREWVAFQAGLKRRAPATSAADAKDAEPGSHHLTKENIAALIADMKACEGGDEFPSIFDRDWRTQCGIIWRVMEHLGSGNSAFSQAARDVLAERRRQVEVEGWHPDQDDDYEDGQLSMAAACYATQGNTPNYGPPDDWPWDREWWKPTDDRRNLVKAAALILADIERIDRTAIAASQKGGA